MSRQTQELQCEAALEFLTQLVTGKTLAFRREGVVVCAVNIHS